MVPTPATDVAPTPRRRRLRRTGLFRSWQLQGHSALPRNLLLRCRQQMLSQGAWKLRPQFGA